MMDLADLFHWTAHFSLCTVLHVQGVATHDTRVSPVRDQNFAFDTAEVDPPSRPPLASYSEVDETPVSRSNRRKLKRQSGKSALLA